MIPERGYTLAEALVALLLLSAGLLAGAAVVLEALRQERAAAHRAAALRVAVSLAEELRAAPRPDGRALLSASGLSPAEACAAHPPSCAAEAAAADALEAAAGGAGRFLPEGAEVSVAVPVADQPSYRIEVVWPAGESEPARLQLAVDT
jgi:type IV pilus modification protein PilV